MMRRVFMGLVWGVVLASAVAAEPEDEAVDPGKDVLGEVKVVVYYGTDGEVAKAGERAVAVKPEVAERLAAEERLRFAHYRQIGQDTKPLFRSYENWAQPLPPSDEILLRFEAQSRLLKNQNQMRMDLELWLSRKKILKTDAEFTVDKPLYVLGPEWRGGRLIFAVELARQKPKP